MSRFKVRSSGLVVPSSIPDAPVGSMSSKPDDHYNFDAMRVFARNGFVIIERADETGSNDDYRQWLPDYARKRMKAMAEQIEQTPVEVKSDPAVKEVQAKTLRFLRRMEVAIKQAEEQGPYTDKSMRQARVRALPKTVAMSGKTFTESKTDDGKS